LRKATPDAEAEALVEAVVSRPVEAAPSPSSPAPSPYLISLPVDFLLVGGGSILLFLLLPLFYDGPVTPALLTASLTLTWLGNWPHNSATIYRLYASPGVSRQYPFTAIVAPLLILAGSLASFSAPATVAPYFVKITLTWVLYHYCGQSIGVSLLYARRARYAPGATERFLLCAFFYGTFFCKSLFSETSSAPLRYFGVVYPRFGVPVVLTYLAAAWTYACAVGFVALLLRRGLRERRWPPLLYLLPAVTQYVWFFVAGAQSAWVEMVPFFHGVQYLTIAWAMQIKQEAERRATPSARFLGWRTVRWYALNLAGGALLFWATPRLVTWAFGMDRLLVTAIVFTAFQVHHSFVDGVIWKLRARSVVTPLLGDLRGLWGRREPERAAA
jgi:hypothetical protein